MNLTIVQITSRKEPQVDWLADSIRKQLKRKERPQLIIIDYWSQACPLDNWSGTDAAVRNCRLVTQCGPGFDVVIRPPKPTVWQGPYRLTAENWWAASNARNTGLCLAQRQYVAFCDDRLVVSDTWLTAVRLAMKKNYAVAGTYEKWANMNVQNGKILSYGELLGKDTRKTPSERLDCPGHWFYSGTCGVPLEWALKVNGFEELMDSLSAEDTLFGSMLQNNGYPMKYDRRMGIIEDRTPDLSPVFRRADKGAIGTEGDKSHEALRRFGGLKRTLHPWNLREIRVILGPGQGGPWPSVTDFPTVDWFDQQPIAEFK